MAKQENSGDVSQYLTFGIGEERYGVEILKVKEILRYETLTSVPRSPRFIRGVINLRGAVVPVVDLAVKFGLEPKPITQWSCIVIVEVQNEEESMVLGLVADSVNQVNDIADGDIEPPPTFGLNGRGKFLAGMAQFDRKFVLLLDIDKTLSIKELEAVSALETPAGIGDFQTSAPAS